MTGCAWGHGKKEQVRMMELACRLEPGGILELGGLEKHWQLQKRQ